MDSVTGIKPTGIVHLGNYLGAIRPALSREGYLFVANYHAMTTVDDSRVLTGGTFHVASALMSLGFDSSRHVLYRQSDIPEVTELAWIFSTLIPPGLLERSHAIKSAKEANRAINVGTFMYPVLMAADILSLGVSEVPVGKDQKQHIEIAQIIANKVNHRCGKEILTVPRAVISAGVGTIPGTDGRKMSKSYDNVIPVLGPPKQIRKLVMGIKTDSTPLEDAKDPESCNVFRLYRHFANEDEVFDMREKYLRGGYGYGQAKNELFQVLQRSFGDARVQYEYLLEHPSLVEEELEHGASIASAKAGNLLKEIRSGMGLVR
jgi:tryptophanyl-tRNA synthetase